MDNIFDGRLDSMAHALLPRNGGDGVYARTQLFERVVDSLSSLIARHREPNAEILGFPPVMSRGQLERSGYVQSFPHLLGCVSCLDGEESEIIELVDARASGGSWVTGLSASDLVLTPAACYPLYPLIALRGYVPAEGWLFDVASYCFRRERSYELDRLQAFRMREFVCVGTSRQAVAFREQWISRAAALAAKLGLAARIAPANDPFFGRAGKLMALSQSEQSLKFELLVPVGSEARPTACMSFNYHRDHFGKTWELRCASGDLAHTSCVAFGIDRFGLALFAAHGLDLQNWPIGVRELLSV
jgi:seryl-tRNA synthetase